MCYDGWQHHYLGDPSSSYLEFKICRPVNGENKREQMRFDQIAELGRESPVGGEWAAIPEGQWYEYSVLDG